MFTSLEPCSDWAALPFSQTAGGKAKHDPGTVRKPKVATCPNVRRSDLVTWHLYGRLTVHGVELDAVRRGHPVRRPLDAELVVVHVVGLNVGDVQVHCRDTGTSLRRAPNQMSVVVVSPKDERTCRPLSGQRLAHAAGVLSHHFNVVGGPRLQVVQSVRGHVTHEEVHGRGCGGVWKTAAQP